MTAFFYDISWYGMMAVGVLFFAALYLGFGALNHALSQWLLPALGYGGRLDPRPIPAGQIRRELRHSALVVLLFGAGMVFPWGLLQLGWARLAPQASAGQIALEMLALIIWNEIHFYLNHRLLHTRWLQRFHLPHHRSVVTTPWATYSLHPLEAMMLGNVILLPMVVHDFSVYSLMMVPVFSIIFNNIGHSNYDFLPDYQHDRWWLNGARRHHLHHACYHGNYGFMFPFMDRWLGTDLPPDAAAEKIRRALAKAEQGDAA
ncbi:sterol desaturase family protein [Chitinibacter tainanensis]|uniref:sterol desaturase family protein n=1 Tax=Chitinibacter tainanensis TaxID=230667 RepID=UPI002352621A|nr:sterol desaturase family protein [Chitinibacter tainanensis]